jgi:hypothetical protein
VGICDDDSDTNDDLELIFADEAKFESVFPGDVVNESIRVVSFQRSTRATAIFLGETDVETINASLLAVSTSLRRLRTSA